MRNRLSLALLAAMLLMMSPALAQQKRLSPHETISTVVDGSRVMIVYGRPYTKSPKTGEVRKIWGGLVPYGKIWRTGADEATLFLTQKPITLGGKTIPAGAYTLWTLPKEDGSAVLIFNRQIGQWGDAPPGVGGFYDEKNDVARVALIKTTPTPPLDQFTITLAKNATGGGGTLTMSWDNAQYSIPFTVSK